MQGQNRFSVIIFLVVLLSILHSSKALKCYVTQFDGSDKEQYCGTLAKCFKFTHKLITIPVRGCTSDSFCNVKDYFKIQECDECETDLCNASTKNVVSTVTILTSGLITLFWSIQ